MVIWKRINARKIALSYIYRDLFFQAQKEPMDTSQNPWTEWPQDIVDIDYDFMNSMGVQEEYEKTQERVTPWYAWLQDPLDDLAMITSWLLIKPDEVDWVFVYQLIDSYPHYIKKIEKIINPLLTQFQWSELDPIKKTVFILWYTEYKTSKDTDDKVIINEMIELSKRFWWIELYKLTNSIFHTLLVKK